MDNKILIVDDFDQNRTLLRLMCKSQGYPTVEAENGLQAIKVAKDERPALILMDIMMPEMDGFEATEKIKSQEETKHIPIIVITALNGRTERLKGIQKGANDFLTKPIDIKELELRVKNNLKVRNYHNLLENYNQDLAKQVEEKTQELQQTLKNLEVAYDKVNGAYKETIHRLSLAAELKDPETGVHIRRVSYYARIVADKLGMEADFLENMFHAAPMHDIGKVGIPDVILLKEGPLSKEEWEVMKTHTTIGHRILKDSSSSILKLATEIALTHHERWDGSGYPQGLKEEQIPISGRIMAIADIYDALRSERPYKKGIDHENTVKIIVDGDKRTRPEHFDPKIITVFKENSHLFKEVYETQRE